MTVKYLVTRNVPCETRVSALEQSVVTDPNLTVDNDGDDWLMSTILSPEEQQRRMDDALEEEFDILDEQGEVVQAMNKASIADSNNKTETGGNDDDDDDDYADMAEFEDDNIMEDDAAATTVVTANNEDANDNIRKVRTYDLSITYDNYYRTPRVWMMGYASADSSQPLTGEHMMEDVMSDYANRTVTIDPHPHIPGPHASIHPCQHGAVMKTIVRNLTKDSDTAPPSVEMYLFIFLKFVSSIIPTITYDFTMDVTASTQK